jgi:dienelactone hydrolase
MKLFLVGLALPLVALALLSARDAKEAKQLPGDEMMHAWLCKQTDKLSRNSLAGAKSKDEWLKLRPKLREQYFDMLGLWPLPERTPLKAKVTGSVERDGVVIEKLHFQSKPGLYVTANLYRPKKVAGKLPAILYVCGHSGRGRDGNKTAFQDHGMWFATNGYVCLIVDTLQLGEIPGKHHGTYNLERFWWQSLGYTPAGVECWNGVRAIDYLVTRPEVDAERIGVTGISGGGASTIWIAAADERVKVAVPVSGMSDLESYVSHRVINSHCDCMLLVNTYQWEWTTIAALVAPRPMLFANSDMDSIFPMDGNRRIIARLRDCYKMLGAPDLVDDYVSKGGHDYRPDLRVAIFQFLERHLKKDTAKVRDAEFKPLPGRELRVFPEDSDIPADALNARIDETFVTPARVTLPAAKDFPAWKEGLIRQLREKSFRTLPDKIPAARKLESVAGAGDQWFTEEGVQFHGRSLFLSLDRPRKRMTLLVLNPEEDPVQAAKFWDKRLEDSYSCYAISPRGGAGTKWTRKNPPNYVERSHALLGTTVDTGRLLDVAATARLIHSRLEGKAELRIVGTGEAGVLAAYAALLEPGISEVMIADPPTSHRQGPHFLNVLRVLDIPDSLGLIAPRPLTLINAKDKAFDRTVEIYERAGARKQLTRE